MIDDRPEISLLLQWLEPLVDWKPFGLLLPGITQQDITTIEDFVIDAEQSKLGLISKWLQKNPTATWRDVLNALSKREEINLLQTINDQLQVDQCTGGNTDAPTSTVPVVSTVSSSVSVITKPVTSTTSGNTPSAILRMNYATLVDAITNNLHRVTNGLYAKGLIPMETVNNIQTAPAFSDVVKSGQLVSVIQQQLESSLNPEQYLIDICHVLINQQHPTLTDIATSILHQLGECVCVHYQ
uniref:Death domain-containing protein n=1 Tax=Amphimedon queenslandica TaxID=400682 RepID=A0A1X7TD34_AMPQE